MKSPLLGGNFRVPPLVRIRYGRTKNREPAGYPGLIESVSSFQVSTKNDVNRR